LRGFWETNPLRGAFRIPSTSPLSKNRLLEGRIPSRPSSPYNPANTPDPTERVPPLGSYHWRSTVHTPCWIPAFAGMTINGAIFFT
jgi:hypothetical protein